MSLDRQNYSFLERIREETAINERFATGDRVDPDPAMVEQRARMCAATADSYYQDRQDRMDETARHVLANLWCTHRPTTIRSREQIEQANNTLQQLANESWQVALALEQTRIGYDCRAMQGKRAQEKEIADAKAVNNVD
jgi:hypothetical protein